MNRSTKRFLHLINLINMFDKTQSEYYLNCINDCDWGLITESLLLEMETTLTDVTMEVNSCRLA